MANLIESIKQSESIQVLARRFVTYLVLSAIFILLGLGIGVNGEVVRRQITSNSHR
ncbi:MULTISPECIES: hypothetical protein [Pseudanabaena]|uniref:hypothetical protein n=1 Tax=Pseudanabaena TaxID=1152 RepID=UPI0024794BB4|nr:MULTISPECIES: hypothetical protein [Pseudanabaena]MEA5490301.1 hypothetical protein [Pseudanabaena sp. CCNP1317]WGS74070.1 hypothetical protein OA858_08595 [Pseudanabaena galeata CCNP1313]